MPLALIYARSENYCIGRDGKLPWHLPDEFAHFNATTMGAAIIMGRKTYEDHCCELPGRFNIVITRQESYPLAPGVHRAASLQSALELASKVCDQVYVIGGVGCLRDALIMADTVYEIQDPIFDSLRRWTKQEVPQELLRFMHGHGKHKVLFGTNYPMVTADKALEGLDDLSLSDETRALFLGQNAQRVFRLGD